MSRNKIDFNNKSKLSMLNEPESKNDDLRLKYTLSRTQPAKVKSFRLREIDIQNLDNTVKRINMSGKIQPIHSTDLVKGLLVMATQMNEEKLINFIKMSY
jgi:disulfide oxidoreductase YuzD